jgi:uncharacterized membrane protein HdeD (DUF308 family)
MSARGKMTNETSEIKTHRGAVALMGNLIAVLGLLVIGYPLAPATIRGMVLGWSLIVVAITQSLLRRHFQATETAAIIVRNTAGSSPGRGRYR